MGDPKKPDSRPESIQSAIRRGRKFTLSEAVGREAAGSLSGASPVARADQVLLEIAQFLAARLADPEGSLRGTITAGLENDPLLLARHFDRPLGALQEFLTAVLGSETLLAALVREADARWGRQYGEKPHFETGDRPPHPDDPYTRAGVRVLLEDLLEDLRRESGAD